MEHYNWAMLTVSTRAFDINIPNRKTPLKALIPILDIINMGASHPELKSAEITNEFTEESGSPLVNFFINGNFNAGDQVSKN